MRRFSGRSFRSHHFIVITALFLTASANIHFFSAMLEIYPWVDHAGFIISACILLLACMVLLLAIFSLVLPDKFVMIFLSWSLHPPRIFLTISAPLLI
jgi:lipid A ethanolaminephosphotransferase